MDPISAMFFIFAAALGVGYGIDSKKEAREEDRQARVEYYQPRAYYSDTVIKPRTTCLTYGGVNKVKVEQCYPIVEVVR